ncbi:hypothetical protein YB2330_002148 [Saitoella coloradoensis]
MSNSTSTDSSSSIVGSGNASLYKGIGIALAVSSGFFIGVSFIFKKKGLLQANAKDQKEAGEGHGYLKSWIWWTGMILMIIGEICNFLAYAFTEAILVTPLGALSVVITAIGSSIFLKERLPFVGKIGCAQCIVGAVIITLNAPEQQSARTIQDVQHYMLSWPFLVYGSLVIITSLILAFWAGPKWGKDNMLIYISICSLIGGLSVVATQGLGASIVTAASGTPQFNHWFMYVLMVFVVITLLTEINYLNKALNIFNTAIVTPTYYVCFTASTIVASAIMFQGFKGTATVIVTVCMGFLVICGGVVLLQLSKSAKNVSDTEVLRGDLDDVKTAVHAEQDDYDPGAEALAGPGAMLGRRMSTMRRARTSRASGLEEGLGIRLRSRRTSTAPQIPELPHRMSSFSAGTERSMSYKRGDEEGHLGVPTQGGRHISFAPQTWGPVPGGDGKTSFQDPRVTTPGISPGNTTQIPATAPAHLQTFPMSHFSPPSPKPSVLETFPDHHEAGIELDEPVPKPPRTPQLRKQFSFGGFLNREAPTEEERMGLVKEDAVTAEALGRMRTRDSDEGEGDLAVRRDSWEEVLDERGRI